MEMTLRQRKERIILKVLTWRWPIKEGLWVVLQAQDGRDAAV
jgi:hypothetical protein